MPTIIPLTLVQKKEAYSELYRLGNEVLDTYNPCQHSGGKCFAGTPCCDGCEHLTPEGCSVEALSCKLWLCYEVTRTEAGAKTNAQFKVLSQIAKELKVPAWLRASKEQCFQNAR